MERLANGRKAGIVKCRGRDVVETDDRDVLGDLEGRLVERPHGANGGDIVISQQCGKGMLALDQLFAIRITQTRRGLFGQNLYDETGIKLQS